MLKDLKGVVNGKTALGVVLGLLVGALLAFTDIADAIGFVPPELVKTILGGLPAILTLFGIWDSAQDEFENIKKQLKAFFASSPALGLVLNIVIQTLDKLPQMDVPVWVETGGIILGSLLVIFGLKGQMAGARANMVPVSAAKLQKYKK